MTNETTLSPPCTIIDAHCHFWDLSLGYHGWISPRVSDLLGDISALCHNYLPETYFQETASWPVAKCIHIEAVSNQYALAEISWLAQLRKLYPQIAGVVAGIDFFAKDCADQLAKYSEVPWIKGVRHILNWHPNSKYAATDRADCLASAKWRAGFKQLAQHGLSFDMQICPGQMDDAFELAAAHPETSIIINHAGMPIVDEMQVWQAGVKQLASCPNVTIKLSGFGMLNHNWDLASIHPIIHHVIECFGARRVMFASNFPVDSLYRDFGNMCATYAQAIAQLTLQEQILLWHDNAMRIYRLGTL